MRFDRLTPREKDHLCALAEMGKGDQRSGGVAEWLGVSLISSCCAPCQTGRAEPLGSYIVPGTRASQDSSKRLKEDSHSFIAMK